MISQISVQDLAQALAAGAPIYLLDVREPWEHDAAKLPGSALVPLGELAARLDEITPPPGARVVAYCHHGVRSLRAAAFLAQAGFDDVASLAGGIDAWSLEIDAAVPRY